MGYMTPEEQQGVLVTIGNLANTIHSLQETIEAQQVEIQRLKETYEPSMDSSKVVHSDNGATDQSLGAPPTGSPGPGGNSGGDGSFLSAPS